MSEPLVITDPAAMSAWSEAARARGERIAFVPTMGALHAGHQALLVEGRRIADRLALSIFVNPTQFGPTEDLSRYPRDLAGDLALAASARTDVAFVPEPLAIYPSGFQTFVEVREVQKGLCGERRPGHFVGVATVVLKLFNIVRPHFALFGEKDFQQLAVIRRMVGDLAVPVEIVGRPTVRESDVLAQPVLVARRSAARGGSVWGAVGGQGAAGGGGGRCGGAPRRGARQDPAGGGSAGLPGAPRR
jgi:pantoate--beta-alanine ligase